jgi:hypothetical protein
MSRTFVLAAAFAAVLAMPRVASADDLGSRQGQSGVITRVGKGVFQLGLDSTFILGVQNEGDESASRLNVTGNLALRYFIKDNLGISIRGGGLYRENGEVTDSGFVGAVWANYYMRLGEGVFLAPGAGTGLLVATREVPAGATVAQTSLLGGIGALEIPLAVFINRRFCLTAGPEIVLSAGSTTPEMGDGESFLAIDGGFKIGAVYSY